MIKGLILLMKILNFVLILLKNNLTQNLHTTELHSQYARAIFAKLIERTKLKLPNRVDYDALVTRLPYQRQRIVCK